MGFKGNTLAMFSLCFAIFLASLGTSMANVALPTVATVFSVTLQQSQLVVIVYLLSLTILVVPAGGIGDFVDRRWLILAGICIFLAASLVCAWAPSFWVLVAARGAQELGASIMMSQSMALVSKMTPDSNLGSAMGLLGTTSAIGTALGPPLGGFIIGTFGWSSIFIFKTALAAISFLVSYKSLPEDRFDKKLSGIKTGKNVKPPMTQEMRFFGNGLFWSLILNALVTSVAMASLIVGPFYLAVALGLSSYQAGLVMSVGPTLSAILGVTAGRLIDHFGSPRIVQLALVVLLLGCLFLALLSSAWGVTGYLVGILMVTTGYASFTSANNTSIMTGSVEGRRGTISGLLNFSRNIGLLTGASAMGAIFAHASGISEMASAEPSSAILGLRVTYAFAGCLIILSLAIHSKSCSSRNHSGRHHKTAEKKSLDLKST